MTGSTSTGEFLTSVRSMRLASIYESLPDDPLREHVIASAAVLRAYRILTSRVEAALVPHDLTMARFEVLGLLLTAPDGRCSFSELKKITLLHPATMGHTIESLEQRNLIRRVRDESDRRAFVAEITDAGRELAVQARASLAGVRFGLEELDAAEARDLCIVLSELRRSAR